MADVEESLMKSPKKGKSMPAPSPAEIEGVRKSTRIKHDARLRKHMSMFVMESRKGDKRSRGSDSSDVDDYDDIIPEKIPRKVEKKVPRSPVKPREKVSTPVKKQEEVKQEVESEAEDDDADIDEPDDGEIDDPRDKSFNLGMFNLRRVGDEAPKSKSSIQLNARGMPQRVRKKNRLFYDDNVVSMPVKNKHARKLTDKKMNKMKTKLEAKDDEPTKFPEDTKEANAIRQKIGLKLRNLLKLPKAQRWVFFEWFYSDIDHVLFNGNNDFLLCLKETFGNLNVSKITRTQWCMARRLMGKPRRCSQSFFREERQTLERKREIIRLIQLRKLRDVSQCKDLPDKIPLQLSVNSRVTAKLRRPQAGLFTGKVDAVDPSNHSYRITFDRAGLGTHSIPDYEVLFDGDPDMLSLSTMQKRYQNSKQNPAKPVKMNVSSDVREWPESMVAKFPRRFYEMMVRICKILKEKKNKVQGLKAMNTEAEKKITLGEPYTVEFQRRYANVIVELESINISLNRYLTTVQKYCHERAPDVCSTLLLAPNYVRDKSLSEAREIVDKYFLGKPQLSNKSLSQLVTELIGLIIQVQNLGQQKTNFQERQVLKQSINKIKTMISPQNLTLFQNQVEVHLQYIETTVTKGNHLSPLIVPSSSKDITAF